MSRTNKSAINSLAGIACSLISSILSFLLQAVFIRLLGVEYSGVNSLFTSILSVLNLAELGFGNAIMFRLYKCISDNDENKIQMYLATYKKICYTIGCFIFIAGLCCTPFLDKIITTKKEFPEPLWSLFIIVLASSVVSQASDYRKNLINAKQDRYINIIVNYGCLFSCHGLQIVSLILFRNIYLYLLIKLFTIIVNGLICGAISKKKYGVGWKSKEKLSNKEWKELSKDVGSLAFYRFCRTLDAHIDTFLISKFVDIATTGIFGSINTLLTALHEVLGAFNDGMIASVGDLYASSKDDKKHFENVFYQSTHFTFLIYGMCAAVLAPFISPFAKWWIEYTLSDVCIYVMLINFFMYGMGMNVATFRNSMGIFVKGWKRPALTALANLIFSVFLAQKLGLIGTLLGTVIARTLTQIWYDPLLICKYGLNTKPYKYYVRYVLYMIITVLISFGMVQLSYVLPEANSFISLVWHGLLYGVCSVTSFAIVGFLFKEQKMVIDRAIGMVKPMILKLLKKRG